MLLHIALMITSRGWEKKLRKELHFAHGGQLVATAASIIIFSLSYSQLPTQRKNICINCYQPWCRGLKVE